MNNQKEKNYLWLIITVGVVLTLIPIIIYFSNFNKGFSKDQGVFGAFGDFINPFLSAFNIILLGYITYWVSRRDDNENEKNRLEQRRIHLSSLRYEWFKENRGRLFSKELHSLEEFTRKLDSTNVFLFPSLKPGSRLRNKCIQLNNEFLKADQLLQEKEAILDEYNNPNPDNTHEASREAWRLEREVNDLQERIYETIQSIILDGDPLDSEKFKFSREYFDENLS